MKKANECVNNIKKELKHIDENKKKVIRRTKMKML